ncbi:MAG: TonB family protein [Burkholderiales bacterium]
MALALVGSVFVHTMLLTIQPVQSTLGLRFASADLDVILVNSQSPRKVSAADALAQVSLQGGGNTEVHVMAASSAPVEALTAMERSVKLAGRRVDQLERSVQELLVINQERTMLQSNPRASKRNSPNSVDSESPINVANNTAINHLQAKIDKEWMNYQKRPRRQFIGANVREAVFATYVERWRQRIEDFGSRHYSKILGNQRLEGVMIVTVSIRSDGTLEDVFIDRSSGSDVLDQAATDIVQRSSPFDSFDSKLSAKFDVLSITRQWSFKKNDLDLK